jgi:ribosomal protein L7/L12
VSQTIDTLVMLLAAAEQRVEERDYEIARLRMEAKPPVPPMEIDDAARLIAAVARHEKIPAIKLLRSVTQGASLLDAKNAVERYWPLLQGAAS